MIDMVLDIIAVGFLLAGTFFFITATIGLIRFPDLFTRMHATGKGDTLGASMILIGLAIHVGLTPETVKILIILVFTLLTSPVSAHAISRAVYTSGAELWVKEAGKGGIGREGGIGR
jgi:multicomponent Na+:H+ antiporter subunit G